MSDPTPAEILATLKAHIESEDKALDRIARSLDGNGQPGLIRSLVLHEERLRAIEGWKNEVVVTRRWLIGLVLTTGLTVLALVLNFFHRG